MAYFDTHMSKEAGWHFADQIGTLNIVHIMDANKGQSLSQRHFTDSLHRCDKIESKLDEIEQICFEINKPINRCDDSQAYLKILRAELAAREEHDRQAAHTFFEEIEDFVAAKHDVILQMYKNHKLLIDKRYVACEFYNLLKDLSSVLPDDTGLYNTVSYDADTNLAKIGGVQFFYLCGVIHSENVSQVQRLTFRLSRGNIFLHTTDLCFDSKYKQLNYSKGGKKSAFFMVFQLGTDELLKQKLKKALESMNAVFYMLPGGTADVDKKMASLHDNVISNEVVIAKSEFYLDQELSQFYMSHDKSPISAIEQYRIIIEKERAIADTLNCMTLRNGLLRGKLWVPEEQAEEFMTFVSGLRNTGYKLNIALTQANYEPRHYKIPTLIKTNDLSDPFQQIVDTYGVPRYREVNPGIFTIISFSYLFGVMYGDIGHGSVLLFTGIALIYNYDKLSQTGFRKVLHYRYMITLLGFFATYCGLVYNEFLAIPWSLFGSCYERANGMFVRKFEDCTVWFGFDPVWYKSEQEVSFMNSFKMKLSIVIGVLHMTLGIACKAINALHFVSYTDFFFEFLPQLVFFWCTFGYMTVAIVLKWLQNWDNGSNAPSIISIYISGGVTKPGEVLYGDSEGKIQTYVQQLLFTIAGISVIFMLFPKPIVLSIRLKLMKLRGQPTKELVEDLKEQFLNDEDKSIDVRPSGVIDEDDPNVVIEPEGHSVSNIFVHQLIEVIEFVLGSVSNTASYLRLWALSLAHGQLAKVFISMTILNPILDGSPFVAIIGFPIFIGATVGVILCMDTMECFLHTLRLHWVEFQNKFYKGDGIKFEPFNFAARIDESLARQREIRGKIFSE